VGIGDMDEENKKDFKNYDNEIKKTWKNT